MKEENEPGGTMRGETSEAEGRGQKATSKKQGMFRNVNGYGQFAVSGP